MSILWAMLGMSGGNVVTHCPNCGCPEFDVTRKGHIVCAFCGYDERPPASSLLDEISAAPDIFALADTMAKASEDEEEEEEEDESIDWYWEDVCYDDFS